MSSVVEAFLGLVLCLPPHGQVVRVVHAPPEVKTVGTGKVIIVYGPPQQAILRSLFGLRYAVPAGRLRAGDWYGGKQP